MTTEEDMARYVESGVETVAEHVRDMYPSAVAALNNALADDPEIKGMTFGISMRLRYEAGQLKTRCKNTVPQGKLTFVTEKACAIEAAPLGKGKDDLPGWSAELNPEGDSAELNDTGEEDE